MNAPLRSGPDLAHLRTLVLNADMQPLSWAPLSVWSWQTAFVAVMQERVIQVKTYDDVVARSGSGAFEVPAVVALKRYRKRRKVAFTRYHLFLRDEFRCQYCGGRFSARELTFDHVVPRSRGGRTSWENIVACCSADNLRKGNKTPREAGMKLMRVPFEPSPHQLDAAARKLPLAQAELHQTWLDFLYWDAEIEH
ncbi:HNH endonuclease [Phaeovulum vinaykumarii]|uniref:5-methylcytosine-specific restriction endonuclease McrA n=1 Tax=Phaeovulum vinaykumarii TaxID=407234 RepID=A0A1N7M3B4_9RHOB|nr:HNH endonuclease [Phaeovulum vinaykumarii]SIS80600.1 5-methylcytosine-specific restriction endonuclease McrA [Phaeovulum vinaykumarii]SOC09103.1 5-methylcytosine-specific restriction endonuclease McrA [Phaeovulum vinaykumarii]